MDTFAVVERATQVLTVIALASGIPPCLHMVKTGDTKNVPFVFFFMGFMNSAVGIAYGQLISNDTIIYINYLAIILSAVFVLSYIAVVKSKSSPSLQLIGGVLFLAVVHYYCFHIVIRKDYVIDIYGVLVFILSLIMLASPALEVIDCVKEKNSDGMSVVMIVGNLSCSMAWMFYGILLKDVFVYAPNFIGVASNLGKAIVKVIYSGGKHKTE